MQFYPIKTSFYCVRSGVCKVVNRLANVFNCHFLWGNGINKTCLCISLAMRINSRWCMRQLAVEQVGMRHTSNMPQLCEYLSILFVYCFGHPFPSFHLFVGVYRRHVYKSNSFRTYKSSFTYLQSCSGSLR